MLDRFLASAGRLDSPQAGSLVDVHTWLDARAQANTFGIEPIPFAELDGWSFLDETGDLAHRSGGFFRVRGLRVAAAAGPVADWSQPIIHQPEIGFLGILVKEIDGVLCMLMQAKMEPGNINTLQLSPTVQATRSNFRRLHGGSATRYLEYFAELGRGRVLVDVLQSEQGGRFYQKRNRNVIVEIDDDVPVYDEFRWLTLGQVHALLREDNVVNMDTRSVLSCLPLHGLARSLDSRTDPFGRAVVASLMHDHGTTEIQNWLNHAKAQSTLTAELIPLRDLAGWRRTDWDISHQDGRYFSVIAASVRASNREVHSWTQPLVAPRGQGIVAFLVSRVDGVLEVLVQARAEAGTPDVVEVGPSVQCIPGTYVDLAPQHRPPFLDLLLAAPEDS